MSKRGNLKSLKLPVKPENRLDPWQEEVLAHEGDLLLCTGRRAGKTYILSRKAIDHMMKHGKDIIVVSLTEDQAMIIIAYALEYARSKYPAAVGKGRNKPTLRSITLMRKGKSVKLISRPVGNTGDATRGFTGGVLIVDEASRMPKMFWIAAKPVLLTQAGEIWMCSTPFGKQGYFWERFNEAYNLKNPKARFRVFYKSTEDVIAERPICDTWTIEQREGALRILEEDKREMSTLEYGQEYQGLFLDDLRQFFPEELVRACMKRDRGSESNYGALRGIVGAGLFLGVDVARLGNDDTVFAEVCKYRKDRLIMTDLAIEKKQHLTDIARLIIKAHQYRKYKRIYIDDNGLGAGVLDILLDDPNTKRKAIGINNTKKAIDTEEGKRKSMKQDLYYNLKKLMEQGKIELFNEPDILLSLTSVQFEYTDKGYTKFYGRYDHIAEALVRAAWCVKDKSLNIFAHFS